MKLCGKQFTIRSGAHEVTVVEIGAGLQRYTLDGVDVTGHYDDDELPPKCCGTTLLPWPNRLRDGRYTFDGASQQIGLTDPDHHCAIHGLGRWERWAKVRQSDDAVTLRLDIVPQKGWPFLLRAELTYTLSADGLAVTVSARNTGDARLPFGAGAHPYLATRGHPIDEVTLRLPARDMLTMDEQQVPVGSSRVAGANDFRRGRRIRDARFDDCFAGLSTSDGRGLAEVRTKSGGAQLWFDDAFRYLQVFTVDDLGGHGPAIAIEPMTCAPDAFNSGDGLLVLEPGETWTAHWGITPVT